MPVNRHQHLIVRAEVTRPPLPTECVEIEQWMRLLISAIEMKTMFGPRAEYCWVEGNRGLTAFAIIETSHIALHAWDESYPPIMQLDVYTCSELPLGRVFDAIERFEPTQVAYKFLDRETHLTVVSESHRPESLLDRWIIRFRRWLGL